MGLLKSIAEFLSGKEYDEYADLQHGWTPDDAEWLLMQFETPQGKQLKKRLLNVAFRASTAACSPIPKDAGQEGGDYRRGRAQGIVDCIQAFEMHMNRELFFQKEKISPTEAHSVNIEAGVPAPLL